MAIRKMKKLSLVALRIDAERLVRELTYLRSVELKPIETPPDGLPAALPGDRPTYDFSENKLLLQTALKLTEKYSTKKKKGGELERSQLEDRERHTDALKAASRAIEVDGEIKALFDEKDETAKKLLALGPWKELRMSPASTETVYTATVIGILPINCDPDAAFGGDDMPDVYVDTVYTDDARRYVSVTFMKRDEVRVATQLARLGFTRVELDRSVTSVATSYTALTERASAIEKEIEDHYSELKKLAEYTDEFKLLYDSYSLDESVESIANGLFYTPGAVLLQGWVPEYKTPALEKKLGEFECFYELEDPREDEEPPVLLKNNAFSAPFEAVLGLYSYPKYRAYDPTPLVSFFFFFIFGFMMQDIGYGVLLIIGCLALMMISKPKGDFQKMLKMFALCGISTIFAGILFGGCFGDLPSSFSQNMLGGGEVDIALWFSPLNDPMMMLYFSLGVGIVQVLAGIAVSGVVKCKRGDVYGAFASDFSWIIVFLGAGLYFVLPGVFAKVGLGICITGVLMIVLMKAKGVKNPILRVGKGLVGLYDAISMMSDILSYSRIMALSLSGAVIANVMNLLGTIAGPTPAGIILFIFMFLIGTALNMALSLLSAFVHSARLQYIEFFGKFYEDGGSPFKPLSPAEKYYSIKSE